MTPAEVEKARDRLRRGWEARTIALLYGVTLQQLENALWANVFPAIPAAPPPRPPDPEVKAAKKPTKSPQAKPQPAPKSRSEGARKQWARQRQDKAKHAAWYKAFRAGWRRWWDSLTAEQKSTIGRTGAKARHATRVNGTNGNGHVNSLE